MGNLESERQAKQMLPPVLDYAGPMVPQTATRPFFRKELTGVYVIVIGIIVELIGLNGVGGLMMFLGGITYCGIRIGSADDMPRLAKAILIPSAMGLLTGLVFATGINGLPILGAWTMIRQVGWKYAEQTGYQVTWLVLIAVSLSVVVGTWLVMKRKGARHHGSK